MSDYEYDTGATRLVISEGLNVRDDKHFVVVSAEHLNDVNVAVAVQDEDAPAVALALLEAAGCDKAGKTRLSRAMIALIEHISAEQVRAEREAEDAKAKAYRDAIFPSVIKWEHLDEDIREAHRARYRTARKFFEES